MQEERLENPEVEPSTSRIEDKLMAADVEDQASKLSVTASVKPMETLETRENFESAISVSSTEATQA